MRSQFARVLVATLAISTACAARTPSAAQPQWQTVGELSHPRAYASAVALTNGKILVVGGLDNADPEVMNYESELIDPRTGSVKVLPQRLLGRLHQSITPAWEDLVVVAGGVEWRDSYWSPVDRVDVFRPSQQQWVIGQPLQQPRSDHAAVALHDGRVLVTGGNANTHLLDSTEIYYPRQDRWIEAAPMPRARTQHSAVTLIDGRVLVTGGIDADGAATSTTFIYDPRRDSWSDGPPLTMPRLLHVVVALPNGDVLLAGGDGPASGTSEIYDVRVGKFVRSGALAYPRLAAQGAALSDGRVVIAGGLPTRIRAFTPLRSAELWDPATGKWTELPPAPTPRAWGTIVTVRGVVYLLSGTGEGETAYRTIERLALN
ncbi:MAG TPA: kelch repeat-containing protein [Candidatus Limnocylindria bacterium]|nr:kelch repeat-containing protein [Candidatus Limnocylindria bacterium]